MPIEDGGKPGLSSCPADQGFGRSRGQKVDGALEIHRRVLASRQGLPMTSDRAVSVSDPILEGPHPARSLLTALGPLPGRLPLLLVISVGPDRESCVQAIRTTVVHRNKVGRCSRMIGTN